MKNIKKLTLTLCLIGLGYNLNAQSNQAKLVVTYDSSMVLAFGEVSGIYFSTDGGESTATFAGVAETAPNHVKNRFWNVEASRKDEINGEWEDHTQKANKGIKFEITFTSMKVEGEGGMQTLYYITNAIPYDSTYLSKLDDYDTWKAEMKKINGKNVAPNSPSSIAKKFLGYAKVGDYKSMKTISDMDKDRVRAKHGDGAIYSKIDKMEKLAVKKTEPIAKTEIADNFKRELEGYTELKSSVVIYFDESTAFVVTHKKDDNHFYGISLSKIDSKWLVTKSDDKLEGLKFEVKGDTYAGMFNAKYKECVLKYLKELNP